MRVSGNFWIEIQSRDANLRLRHIKLWGRVGDALPTLVKVVFVVS